MSHIKLARVDDRLIHGQVVTNWLQFTGAKQIVIIDDGTANDPFTSRIISMAAPSGTELKIFTVDKAIDFLNNELSVPTLLLAKTPKVYFDLVKGGVGITHVILGGMGASKNRTKLYKNISASQEDRQYIKELLDHNVTVSVQIISSDKAVTVTEKLLGV